MSVSPTMQPDAPDLPEVRCPQCRTLWFEGWLTVGLIVIQCRKCGKKFRLTKLDRRAAMC